MATATTHIEGLGDVVIIRRRGLKNLSLRVDHTGTIKLNLPWFVPKTAGINFAKSRKEWLSNQILARQKTYKDGSRIGDWTLRIVQAPDKKPSWKLHERALAVSVPKGQDDQLKNILENALYEMAAESLVKRLSELAREHNFTYTKVRISRAKGRWGSCTHKGSISLNSMLVSLPRHIADYVILHELCHTKELNHSPKFWKLMLQCDPKYMQNRKELRKYKPYL